MKELAASAPGKTMVIIDDSASLAKAVVLYNTQRSSDEPFLVQIVYPGPLTEGKIAKNELVEDREHGVFISTGWEHMGSVLQSVEQWTTQHSHHGSRS